MKKNTNIKRHNGKIIKEDRWGISGKSSVATEIEQTEKELFLNNAGPLCRQKIGK
jgi:hypothetical protein